jgi:hypothetical protein
METVEGSLVNVPPDRNTFRTSPVRYTPDRAVIQEIGVDPVAVPN